MTSSNENIFRVIGHLCGEFTGPGVLMFSLICVWINDWVNTRGAGGLRRYRAHYYVTVMWGFSSSILKLSCPLRVGRSSPQHFESEIKWTTSCPRHFHIHFPRRKVFLSYSNLKCVPNDLIHNKSALCQIIIWRGISDKPLFETMMAYFYKAYMHHSASVN